MKQLKFDINKKHRRIILQVKKMFSNWNYSEVDYIIIIIIIIYFNVHIILSERFVIMEVYMLKVNQNDLYRNWK